MNNHYWEGIGCRGRIIIGQELGANEGFLFYEESLKGRIWVQRKGFLFYEESLYRDGIGSKGRFPLL
jgi:hypothetical protein